MDIKNTFNKLLPHLLIILGFAALSYAYYNPILAGKQLPQMDDTHAIGAANELTQYEKEHPGEHPRWTNSMFGGMPAYLIKGGETNSIYHKIQPYIRLFLPYTTVAIVFLLLAGFYIALVTLGANKYLSIAGAIGFAFASFNIMIISVGHVTQAYAIAITPLVIAGFLLLFRKKYIAGGILATFALGIEISFSHPQITYYCMMAVLLLFIVELVYALLNKEIKHFLIVSGISVAIIIFSVLPNIVNLWTTYEYGKYSMRGGTELTHTTENTNKKGLEKDYALSWSYGISESFSVLVPNIKGAGVRGFKEDSHTAKKAQEIGLSEPEQFAASLPVYWGDLPWTDGTIYFGAIICFLFIFGLFVVKGPIKWWLLAASLLSFMLAWGKYFPLSNLFFDYFPGYNKFRTVEMIIVIANFAFPLLGFLALAELLKNKMNKEEAFKALKYSLYIVGGLLLIFILLPGWFFNFKSVYPQFNDKALMDQLRSQSQWSSDIINELMRAIYADRKSILKLDALRSLFYVGIAAGLIWAYINKKINITYFSIILAAAITIDMWSVTRRTFNSDNYVSKSEYHNQFVKTAADDFILKDTDPNFRVMNFTQSLFNDAYTPYYHKSIGGYSGAKMRRYQDLIEGPLYKNIVLFQTIYNSRPTLEQFSEEMEKMSILNMLNTKYIIINADNPPVINTAALGNAWFVKEIKWVNNPDEEYAALDSFSPRTMAIADKRFQNIFNIDISFDSTASIKLLSYAPDKLQYQAKCAKPQLAVFSEVYYDKGWNAYIDGKLVPHGRVNYILRAMIIPEGEHKIDFKFEPKSYYTGKNIAAISSIAIVILVLIAAFYVYKRSNATSSETNK